MSIERVLFEIAGALRIPVLILAVLALAAVLVELGALLVEWRRRHRRDIARLEQLIDVARRALSEDDIPKALQAVHQIATTSAMDEALRSIVLQRGAPHADERIAKRLANYEYTHLRRLERTRILVRFGPALGLMGTLIPLSPALSGLARGKISDLTNNLRVAFSVTVVGLLVGAIAFAISLIRDRLYGQDFSDVEYVAATLAEVPQVEGAAADVAALTPMEGQ